MTTAGKFTCEACGKAYTWKPELAGKRAKCKCGAALHVPATDPALAVAEAPAAVEQAALHCPSCGAEVDPAAVICINCGHNRKTGKQLTTTMAKVEVVVDAENDEADEADEAPPSPKADAAARRLKDREAAAASVRMKLVAAVVLVVVVAVVGIVFVMRR